MTTTVFDVKVYDKTLQITNKTKDLNWQPCLPYDLLREYLPHGSGIDYDWKFETLKNRTVLCHNSFHGMDQHGSYDGIQDFTVHIYRHNSDHISFSHNMQRIHIEHERDDITFTLHLNRPHLNRNWTYGLKDYLEDTIYHHLSISPIPTPNPRYYHITPVIFKQTTDRIQAQIVE